MSPANNPKLVLRLITYGLAAGFLILMMAFSCRYQEPTSQVAIHTSILDQEELWFKQQLDTFFKTQMKKVHCPGAAVVVVKDTSVVYIKGFGVKNVNFPDSINTNTVFRIGSLSKGFAGVLAGKLIDQGYFGWNDKVAQIIPSFNLKDKDQARRITVKNILSHTTGIGKHAYTNLIESGMSLNDIIPRFSKVKVYGKEGEFFAYQNAAFAMIEEIILAKTNTKFADKLSSEIFEPAGMLTASATYENLVETENVALPHRWSRKRKTYYIVPIHQKYYNSASAGGINASISDMGNWLKVLLGNMPEVVPQQVLDAVFQPVVKVEDRRAYRRWDGFREAYYGIGWRILKHADKDIAYHAGFVNNFVSQIAIDREEKLAICLLFNAPSSSINKVIPEFLKEYNKYKELYAAD